VGTRRADAEVNTEDSVGEFRLDDEELDGDVVGALGR